VTSRTHAAIKDEGNSADPEAAAEARKAEFARMEDEGGKTAASPAGNGQALRESHQEALYKQACKLVSTMNATTRGSFIAYLVGQYGQPT
jgi:hypothetical protein